MVRKTYRALLVLLCMVALSGALHAQTAKTITIRLLDGKTGKAISTTGFLVRANHLPEVHVDWTRVNEDGTGELKVPADASALSIHATYENSMEIYVNCDGAKQIDSPSALWYSVSEIMTTGVVAPNGCVKPKDADKLKATAKPGEFVLFVRKLNWKEQSQE